MSTESDAPLLNAEGASLLLAKNHDQLEFAVVSGPSADKLQGQTIPASEGVASEVLQTGQPVLESGRSARKRVYQGVEAVSGYRTQAIIAAPLKFDDQVVGVIEAVNRQPGVFRADDLKTLEIVSRLVAASIEYILQQEVPKGRNGELAVLSSTSEIISSALKSNELLYNLVMAILHGVAYVAGESPTTVGVKKLGQPAPFDAWLNQVFDETITKLRKHKRATHPTKYEKMLEIARKKGFRNICINDFVLLFPRAKDRKRQALAYLGKLNRKHLNPRGVHIGALRRGLPYEVLVIDREVE